MKLLVEFLHIAVDTANIWKTLKLKPFVVYLLLNLFKYLQYTVAFERDNAFYAGDAVSISMLQAHIFFVITSRLPLLIIT
ncbi:hypothetical protein CHUAL_009946 [Chamberlinius hualienensis]